MRSGRDYDSLIQMTLQYCHQHAACTVTMKEHAWMNLEQPPGFSVWAEMEKYGREPKLTRQAKVYAGCLQHTKSLGVRHGVFDCPSR